ncbi:MAG TPA: hypothetical protein VKE74_21880 [Gemmataceae bacterium]|nr:hypothetical protein [Gemmataceae bacterium]
MRRLALLGPLWALLALATAGGCGDALNRQEVTGEVTLRGQPVEDGIIQFAPLDGQPTGDGAQIVNGKYRIPKEKGLSPGKYKVTIYAGDGRSGTGNASPDSPYAGTKPGQERIPAEYNKNSNVVKEVTANGPNKFDFPIP